MSASLHPGSLFANRFEVVRELARGGMGTVYAVKVRATGSLAALKVLSAEGCFDDEARRRFLAEARTTPSDESDHIVRVIDADITEQRPWILMEYLDGATLREALTLQGALTLASVTRVLEQLCHGLGRAHARGIVHRDLKPENVFLHQPRAARAEPQVKLLDFGVAKTLSQVRAYNGASIIVGTEGWWAPEQAWGREVSPATDVWALGLLTYWMLTGAQFSFAGQGDGAASATAAAARIGRAHLLPSTFDDWFAHCVAPDPAHRFAHADAVWNAWRSLTRDAIAASPRRIPPTAPSPFATAEPPPRPSRPAARRPSRGPPLGRGLFAVAALFAAALVGGALLVPEVGAALVHAMTALRP